MQAFRCATWRLRSASRRRRSTTIFSNKIDFYRHAVDHAIKQVTDSIEADCAFRTARLPRGCAASSAAFPPTTTAAFSFSACSSTRIARMRSASRSPPTTARSAGRRKPARRARALPPRARLPHRGARCGDARLSSDMNAMYAHYDAVLAGLRLRHAMSEL